MAIIERKDLILVLVSCHRVCFIGTEFKRQSGAPARWFLPFKDPCQCTAVRLGGIYTPASSYRQGAPLYLDELFLSEDPLEIQDYFKCSRTEAGPTEPETTTVGCSTPRPLGMEDGTIPDERISASSYKGPSGSSDARLNSNWRWTPLSNERSWIEVDLAVSTLVSGVITQGGPGGMRYVKRYLVSYQRQHSSDRVHVTDGNGEAKVFTGNSDGNTPVTNTFKASVLATTVRIEPTEWHHNVGLRFELLGCRLD
ncbi:lactadherin-like isoform X2 [Acanthaster planci]|uniref:Lactadherin-like isoform X2 n=1 Tax=Acanthaster planci TaxID=133434 RepID=A0A8B7XUN5_ACAPL|nr:lactadherin-like isoform X2 [Acanthaster planci]